MKQTYCFFSTFAHRVLTAASARAKLLTAIALCLFSVGNIWGDSWSHTITTSDKVANGSITINDVMWNVETVIGNGSPTITNAKTYSKQGLKFGTSKTVYFKSFTFSTNAFENAKVSKVEVEVLLNAGVNTTLTAKQNDVQIGKATYSTGSGSPA